jgi:hypothetical protein
MTAEKPLFYGGQPSAVGGPSVPKGHFVDKIWLNLSGIR